MKDVIIIIIIVLLIVGWIGWLQFSARPEPEEILSQEIAPEEILSPESEEDAENKEDTEEMEEETTKDKTKDITDEEKTTEPEKETEAEKEPETFVQCLANEGVVIYGMRTCPACRQLADSFGGYDAISLIYVECSQEQERCRNEMKTNYVPEIQIIGELFEGRRTPQDLSSATGCAL